MDEELRSKLIKDLEKSGFASEMRAIQTIRDKGWESSGAGTYFDLDANITRTIDVKAYRLARNWEVGDGGVDSAAARKAGKCRRTPFTSVDRLFGETRTW
jgi:hypothetical protein